jgi:hypothetical protein
MTYVFLLKLYDCSLEQLMCLLNCHYGMCETERLLLRTIIFGTFRGRYIGPHKGSDSFMHISSRISCMKANKIFWYNKKVADQMERTRSGPPPSTAMNSLKRQSKLERTNRPTIESGEDHAQKPQIIPRTVMVGGLTMCVNNSYLVGQLRLRFELLRGLVQSDYNFLNTDCP